MKKGTLLLLPICGLALTLVITSFVSSPTRASATSPLVGHVYHIVNKNSGKLMEVYNNDSSDGAKVDQWESSGCHCQNWEFEVAGYNNSSGTTDDTKYMYYIFNEGTGGYLGVPQSSSEGTQVEAFSSSPSSSYGTNLEWTINETEYPGYATITNVSSGLVLGIDQESSEDGAKVVQWQDNGTSDHKWDFECVGSCN